MIRNLRIPFFGTRLSVEHLALLLLTLAALGVRLLWLAEVPPGWRDDELINSLVISQKVLDGDLAFYYPDASGHEALYHALNALFLAAFGPGVAGIRWLSVLLGTLTVPLTYLVGKRLWASSVGFVAAAGLTFSFWSLIYSRIGLRHILMPLLVLAAFYFFWQPTEISGKGRRAMLLSAFFVALGFYTYFAGRGVPLILLAFIAYLLLVAPDQIRRLWRGWVLLFGTAVLLALPLAFTLQQQPEAEGRVAELAVPLVAAGEGDFAPLLRHVRITLNMFHSDGDDEWLYNIPHRPVFGPVGALFFWGGVLLAVWYALEPLVRHPRALIRNPLSLIRPQVEARSLLPGRHAAAGAFLLLWWLAGISPAFISVPPASLGHTILAQPATYLLAALPAWWLGEKSGARPLWGVGLAGALLVGSVMVRDLPDYFVTWPQRGLVRFLYRGSIHDVADYLAETQELQDFGMTGLLAGPWDRLALEVEMQGETAVSPRWFHPERALLLHPSRSFVGWPNVPMAYAERITPLGVDLGEYELVQVEPIPAVAEPDCFVNGLCLVTAVYHPETGVVELAWQVDSPLQLPHQPLISNPPPPGVYNGPRLQAFAQLWDGADNFLAGDDGMWADPYTLQPGDLFLQQHWPSLPDGAAPVTLAVGLYDPLTGERILTQDGRDYLRFDLEELSD